MTRRNIFDLLTNNFDQMKEMSRIDRLFRSEKFYTVGKHSVITIYDFVEIHCFPKWKNRGHCIDLRDFLETVQYSDAMRFSTCDINWLFTFIEIVYNCWWMAFRNGFPEIIDPEDEQIFKLLCRTMDDCLAHFNHKAVYFEDQEQLIVIEDNPAITATAEIIEQDLAYSVLRYNHFLLKGDLKAKRSILLAIGAGLEPKRKQLTALNSSLDDIFFMLNNLNLRHNNCTEGDRNYRKAVANFDDTTMEEWYDELYQMMLLAYLEIDHENRKSKIKLLKAQINGES